MATGASKTISAPAGAVESRAWRSAGIVFLSAWVAWFAGAGLTAFFSIDDLMNLHGYLSKPVPVLLLDNIRYWSPSYRPLGGLFYVSLYHLFGFHPLPFRIVCFGLIAINLVLLFRTAFLLSKSREIAFLATFLVSYNASFTDLYYSSGTVFDLLCFSFYFGVLLVYLRIRSSGRLLSGAQTALMAVLYICALNAKEMAVTLPVSVALYELLYQRPRWTARAWLEWPIQGGRTTFVLTALTVPYVIGKLTLPGSLTENPAYSISVSPGRFLDAFHLYLNAFFYQHGAFRDPNTVQLIAVMLAVAVWRRSRLLLFAWCFLLYSVLPVAFIHHYSGFFMYIPSVGWALYGAGVLAALKNRFVLWLGRTTLHHELADRVATVALVGILALVLAPAHARASVSALRLFNSVQPPSREIAAQLLREQPVMKRGARVLFVGDPFPRGQYFLVFITRLTYRDMTINVTKAADRPCGPGQAGRYDVVFLYRAGVLERMGACTGNAGTTAARAAAVPARVKWCRQRTRLSLVPYYSPRRCS